MSYLSEEQMEILHAITAEIIRQAAGCSAEQYHPVRDPDASDDYIKTSKENVEKLRKIRAELEVLFTGVLL